jgi:cytochrome b6-f complex iron-sulfur subunit
VSVDRRTVLRGCAGGAAVALCVAACGTEQDPGPGTAPGEDVPGQRVPQDESPGDTPGTSDGEVLVPLAEVPVGGAVVLTSAGGERLVVARPEEDRVVGFSAVCTHLGCVVEAEGAELHCGCHGSRFDAASGGVLQGPAPDPLPEVQVRVEGEDVVLG